MTYLRVVVCTENFEWSFPFDETKTEIDYKEEFYTIWAKRIIKNHFKPFEHDPNVVLSDEFVEAVKNDLVEYGELYDFEEFLRNYIECTQQ